MKEEINKTTPLTPQRGGGQPRRLLRSAADQNPTQVSRCPSYPMLPGLLIFLLLWWGVLPQWAPHPHLLSAVFVDPPSQGGVGKGGAAHLTQACPSDPSPEAHPELSDSDIKITPHKSPCPQEAPIQQERHIGNPCKRVARTGVQSARD